MGVLILEQEDRFVRGCCTTSRRENSTRSALLEKAPRTPRRTGLGSSSTGEVQGQEQAIDASLISAEGESLRIKSSIPCLEVWDASCYTTGCPGRVEENYYDSISQKLESTSEYSFTLKMLRDRGFTVAADLVKTRSVLLMVHRFSLLSVWP
jgi:hypothetical protein